MAFKIVGRMEEKRHRADEYRLREVELQFQLDFVADTNQGIVWEEAHLPFEHTLYWAPGQRQNDNDIPHVWFGKTIDSGPPCIVDAHISDWDVDASGHFTGATVRLGVHDPSGGSSGLVRGQLHVTIQGLGAPNDSSDE